MSIITCEAANSRKFKKTAQNTAFWVNLGLRLLWFDLLITMGLEIIVCIKWGQIFKVLMNWSYIIQLTWGLSHSKRSCWFFVPNSPKFSLRDLKFGHEVDLWTGFIFGSAFALTGTRLRWGNLVQSYELFLSPPLRVIAFKMVMLVFPA